MKTDKHDRLAANGDGEFSRIVRAAIDEIRRDEPEDVSVEGVIVRTLGIPMLCEGPEQSKPTLGKEENMRRSWFARMPPMMKLAAGFVLAAVLIGTGWAAERLYVKWNGVSITLESYPGRSVTLPNGATLDLGGWETTSGIISSDPGDLGPNAVERAKRHHEEQNKLIAEKKYKFEKIREFLGQKCYVYTFAFADGSQGAMTVDLPLETVTSWDDYRQKQQEQTEKIYKAVVAGNFRLIDVNTIDDWICRDVGSNEKLDVRHVSDTAQATVEAAKEPKQMQVMSWQDHLKAIREGRRELLGPKNDTYYTYEAVLDDGSKATFVQDHRLTKLEELEKKGK